MKKTILFFISFCCIATTVWAQNEEAEEKYSVLSSDSTFSDIGLMPEVLDENVNKLLESWHAQYFLKSETYCLDDSENVFFPEEIYQQRLSKLPCLVPMNYNPIVRSCIDLYASRRRDLVRYMMGMADFYFPIFEQILDEHGLPDELKYLAVVESALNPKALSRVGAAGLWQFMLPTGKSYDLEINSLIDERLDPVKSTHAACKYFKDMYAVYGDWHLVLASYNCGPGNVNKAIRRSGGKTNFWDIYPHLPKETRSYVPLFIAATYIMNYHCEHNLCPLKTNLSMATDTVMINNILHLKQASEVLNIDMELLSLLNPQYKREIIPGNIEPCVLKLPASATASFIDNESKLYTHRAEELLANCNTVNHLTSETNQSTRETIKHSVKSGENLYTIANRYGVTAQNLRKWNGLKSNKVRPGRKITVHIDNGGISYSDNNEQVEESASSKLNNSSEKKVAQNKPKSESKSSSKGNQKSTSETQSYRVKSGDSLYSISKKYPGVSVAKIQNANQMRNNKLKIGQVLIIPVS